MNKLEEQREELVRSLAIQYQVFQQPVRVGFDAAIALDLPVKFATWKHNHPYNKRNRDLWVEILAWNNLKPPSISELYQYWITHIYKPE